MERPDRVPVDKAAEAVGIKHRRLVDRDLAVAGHHLELEPAPARHLHLGRQPQPSGRVADLDPPAVERVARAEPIGIVAAAAHARTAHQPVEPAAERPQPVGGIPAVLSPDPLDRREGLARGDGHDPVPAVYQPRALGDAAIAMGQILGVGEVGPTLAGKVAVLLLARLANGRGKVAGPDCKLPRCQVVGDHGRVLEPVDQLSSDFRIPRRHELEPQAREPRREHRHGDHEPSQAPLPGILLHDAAVRHLVWPANLEDPRRPGRQVGRSGEVGDDIGDRDRLGGGGEPGRTNHDGQPLDERADQVKRKAAGPHDD